MDHPSNRYQQETNQQGTGKKAPMADHLSMIEQQHKEKVQLYKRLAMQQVSTLKTLNNQIDELDVQTVKKGEIQEKEAKIAELHQINIT